MSALGNWLPMRTNAPVYACNGAMPLIDIPASSTAKTNANRDNSGCVEASLHYIALPAGAGALRNQSSNDG
jgi:hypothetical protein